MSDDSPNSKKNKKKTRSLTISTGIYEIKVVQHANEPSDHSAQLIYYIANASDSLKVVDSLTEEAQGCFEQ